MLKIRLLVIGKAKGAWPTDAARHFEKLLSRYCSFELIEIPEIKHSPDGSTESIKVAESAKLLSRVQADRLFCFDLAGERYTSESFADLLRKTMNSGVGSIDLALGGAFGFSQEIKEKADQLISLSDLTLSHQVERVVALEQLYRAFSILSGSSYHK